MGRNKIKIERIPNDKLRQITLLKRKRGVLKKAMELSLLCEAKVLLIIYDDFEKKSIFYSSEEDAKSFANEYFEQQKPNTENFTNRDYNPEFYKENESTKSHKSENFEEKKSPATERKNSMVFIPEVLIDEKFEVSSNEAKKVVENLIEMKTEEKEKTPKSPSVKMLNQKRGSPRNSPKFEPSFISPVFFGKNPHPSLFYNMNMNSSIFNPIPQNVILSPTPQRNNNLQNEMQKLFLQNYMNMCMLSNSQH